MNERTLLGGLLGILAFQFPLFASILHVPLEYNTIQSAIDDCNDGDTVLVAPGTYTGDGNRDIEFRGKAITVRSEAGPETCIIDCQGKKEEHHRGFYFHGLEDASSVLQGFTIKNGYMGDINSNRVELNTGGGIHCHYKAKPLIGNCILEHNYAYLGGGGVACGSATISNCLVQYNATDYFDSAGGVTCGKAVIRDCIIKANEGGGIGCGGSTISNCVIAENLGFGVSVSYDSDANIAGCTVVSNRSLSCGGGFYFPAGSSEKCVISNTIIWGNTAGNGGDQIGAGYDPRGGARPTSTVSFKYCFIQSDPNAGYWPEHDWHETLKDGVILQDDPGFADPNKGDYHLKSQAGRWDPVRKTWNRDDVTSPCIDAGDPNSPIGLEPFPNGGRINMGAYGGTAEASKSYFGKPVCETIIAGDINGDCGVDLKDVAILAAHWLEDRNP